MDNSKIWRRLGASIVVAGIGLTAVVSPAGRSAAPDDLVPS